jgi:hypothetical protein
LLQVSQAYFVTDYRMPQIFISYRRKDNPYAVGLIYDALRKEYGSDSVFIDIDNIPLGQDFEAVLNERLNNTDLVLVVVGDKWLERDEDGRLRLEDPTDFVRVEIEASLRRGIPVIPLLVGDAHVPKAVDLPGALAEFSMRNATPMRAGVDFPGHMRRLIHSIDEQFPRPASTIKWFKRGAIKWLAAIPAVIIAVVLGPKIQQVVSPEPAAQLSIINLSHSRKVYLDLLEDYPLAATVYNSGNAIASRVKVCVRVAEMPSDDVPLWDASDVLELEETGAVEFPPEPATCSNEVALLPGEKEEITVSIKFNKEGNYMAIVGAGSGFTIRAYFDEIIFLGVAGATGP